MSRNITAFWHKESFDWLMKHRLSRILEARLPLVAYHFQSTGVYTCRVEIALASTSGNVDGVYTNIPQPDAEGIFDFDGQCRVVVPTTENEELDTAEIRCVGQQLSDALELRLEKVLDDVAWNTSVVQTSLPIDRWVREFLCNEPSAHILREQNWLDRHTHLRRINVQWRDKIYRPGHFGRVCPFEMPEGSNVGKILSVAVGAQIRDGRLVIVSNQPGDALGLTATMVPFLEHNDTNRQLMGVNMMRQYYIPSHPEPALVQTGNEPDMPDFWYGRNVLTAFVSWGVDTFEDAITISESCAKRFNYPHPVESGDKFANRHGAKGCITRILPDDEMPHLADGTPVELVYNFLGQLTRLNFGQAREAVMGRIAHAEGRPAIVLPFQAPNEMEIRNRLRNAGLPEDGMEYLTLGRNGKKLQRPSLVGWVYWGRLHHIAREKITVSIDNREEAQRVSNAEYAVLRDVSAFENLQERVNTCSANRGDIDTLANRVATGTIQQADPPSPMFANLARRLALTGIRVDFDGEKLRFRFERPNGKILKLARSIPHPF